MSHLVHPVTSLRIILILILEILLHRLSGRIQMREGEDDTSLPSRINMSECPSPELYMDIEEVLATLRLRAFLMPIDDCLIRHAVLVIQDLESVTMVLSTLTPELATNLQDLRECLHDPRVLIAVRLHSVDERDLRLWAWTERFDDRREALHNVQMVGDMVSKLGSATYRDFAQSKALNLIRACAPVHLSHKALPEARDKFGLRERTLLNDGVHSSDDLFPSTFSNPRAPFPPQKKGGKYEFGRTSEGWSSRSKASLMALVMSSLMRAFCLRVHQFRDLRKARAAEVRVEHCVRTFVRGEENEKVFDPALLERPGNMVHRRLGNIGAQDHRQDVHRNVCKVKPDARMMNAQ